MLLRREVKQRKKDEGRREEGLLWNAGSKEAFLRK